MVKPPISRHCKKTPRQQTGVGNLPESVYLIHAVVVFGCKIECIS